MKDELTLKSLEVFKKLCENLSFSEAAHQLGLAQSNVSRQLKILEETLGVTLVSRSRHSVQLTAEGERLREEIFPVTEELQQRLQNFRSALHDEQGTVRIGCFSEFGQSDLLPAVLAFRKEFPNIVLDISFLREAEILDRLSHAKLDFGILGRPPIVERLRSYPLVKQEIVLAVPKGDRPRTWDEEAIFETPFVAYERGDALLSEAWNVFFKDQRTASRRPNVLLTVNSHRSMLDAIASGGYAAVVPLRSIEQHHDQDRIEALAHYRFEVPLYLVHAATQWLPRKDELFKKSLFATFRKAPAKLSEK